MAPRGLASPLPCRGQDTGASGMVTTRPGLQSFRVRAGTFEEPPKGPGALKREELNQVREKGMKHK